MESAFIVILNHIKIKARNFEEHQVLGKTPNFSYDG